MSAKLIEIASKFLKKSMEPIVSFLSHGKGHKIMRVFYITRTYVTDADSVNCAGLRNYTVELLRRKYEVIVVTPNYESNTIIDRDGIIMIPYKFRRVDSYLQRVGIYEDYLKRWVWDSIKYLDKLVKKDDVLMPVSGGELGCIMLAAKLKERYGCKVIINFHDPIAATTINGRKMALQLHINRGKILRKYLKCADQIITCSDAYRKILVNRYKEVLPHIQNIYRGYRGKVLDIKPRERHNPVRIVYAGSMNSAQGADCFIDMYGDRQDVEIVYVGKASEKIKEKAKKKKNVRIVPSMLHDQYIDYIQKEADIGLVALKGAEFGACVPSKIFELINLEIPILGILPDGDGKDIINSGYGLAIDRYNYAEANSTLDKLLDKDFSVEIIKKMKRDKNGWQMEKLFENVYEIIDKIITVQ